MKATSPGAPPPTPATEPSAKAGRCSLLPRAPSHARFQVPEQRGQQSLGPRWGRMQALTHWTWAQVMTPLWHTQVEQGLLAGTQLLPSGCSSP